MESKFTGGLLGLIGTNLLCFFLRLFTLGFGTPWAVCIKARWVARHTIIDGKQLTFVGTGGALFGKWIVWILLSFITLGIYMFWVVIAMQKWLTKNTHTA